MVDVDLIEAEGYAEREDPHATLKRGVKGLTTVREVWAQCPRDLLWDLYARGCSPDTGLCVGKSRCVNLFAWSRSLVALQPAQIPDALLTLRFVNKEVNCSPADGDAKSQMVTANLNEKVLDFVTGGRA
ncbi:MAG: hypothetical protein OXH19_04265 [Chloroflexi bacterium]|nr:hypothetical protein [Chloroflexota bacterium]MCY3588218.1 hypothetical protein [Chloroflexota bacterium]MCY3687077.1 hypothetical protein [Chloroflexota bacterium]MDE2708618.1 hypothetical protein [Chloroflexota bacterium]